MASTTELVKQNAMTPALMLAAIIESKVGEDIPRIWTQYIESWIDGLRNDFWSKVSEAPDYRAMKRERRFFPVTKYGKTSEEKKELKAIGEKVIQSEYPEMEGGKPANYVKANLHEITNFGTIPVRDPTAPATIVQAELHAIISCCRESNQYDLIAKTVYYICIGYDTCHLMFADTYVAKLLAELLSTKYRDIMIAGIKYGNMILAHEEEVTRGKFGAAIENMRWVLRLSEIQSLEWLQDIAKLPIQQNPLLTNCTMGSDINSQLFMYLSGERSMPDVKTISERIHSATAGALAGIHEALNFEDGKRRNYVNLCGSMMTQIGGENTLGDYKTRSELYFAGGDIDIMVSEQKYKVFINVVDKIRKIIGANLGIDDLTVEIVQSKSGVRFALRHPKLARHIEIFRTPVDPVKLVSEFHMPAVKALWNFTDLIMCRSYLLTMLTGVCESFDWFSTNKNPMDIILKNAQRGYCTHLNGKEHVAIVEYISIPGRQWSYPIKNATTGTHTRTDIFFRVDVMPLGVRFGLPVIKSGEPLELSPPGSVYTSALSLKYKGTPIAFHREGSGNQWHIAPPPQF